MTNQLLAELEMANRQLQEKDKEIERLRNILEKMGTNPNEILYLKDEVDRLNNIIEGQQIEIKKSWKEINKYKNIIDELKDDSRVLKEFSAWIVNRHEPDLFHKMEIVNKLSKLKEGK